MTVHYSEPVAVSSAATPADVQKAMAQKSRKSPSLIPPIYSQADKTMLKHRVPDDGPVKLELKSVPLRVLNRAKPQATAPSSAVHGDCTHCSTAAARSLRTPV